MVNPFNAGDEVMYKTGDAGTFIVFGVYGDTHVTLSQRDRPDREHGYLTDIKELVKL